MTTPTKKKIPPSMKYELIENGLDFILSGLEHLGKVKLEKRDYKFGVLHLAAGIELILKERLRREHWSLLFENVDKANVAALASGDFKSVGFEHLLERLGGVAKITIQPHEAKAVDELRKRRNKIQHLFIDESHEAIESIAARAVGFVLDFIATHLRADTLNSGEQQAFDDIKDALKDFKAFVEKRLVYIKPKLDKAINDGSVIIPCVRCLQDAMVIEGEEQVKCLFCNSGFNALEVASVWADTFLGRSDWEQLKDGGPPPTMRCPSCDENALVEVGDAEAGHPLQWLCFQCGDHWTAGKLDECMRCGKLFVMDGEMTVCNDCFDESAR